MERLCDLIDSRETAVIADLQQCTIHSLVMHVTLSKLEGIGNIFAAMRFPLTTGKLAGFGELPITFIESPITTVRPLTKSSFKRWKSPEPPSLKRSSAWTRSWSCGTR